MWLPHLQWLDFTAVTPEEHTAALDAEAQLPETILRKEKAEADAEHRQEAMMDQVRELRNTGLLFLSELWDRMSGEKTGRIFIDGLEEEEDEEEEEEEEKEEEDMERDRVLRLPGVRAKWAAYAATVKTILGQEMERILEVARRAQREAEAADAALESVRAQSSLRAHERLMEYLAQFKRLQRQMASGASLSVTTESASVLEARARLNREAGAGKALDPDQAARAIALCRAENDKLREELLIDEMRSHEQCTEIINRFDVAHSALATERADKIEGLLR
jgi:hypothetical protein